MAKLNEKDKEVLDLQSEVDKLNIQKNKLGTEIVNKTVELNKLNEGIMAVEEKAKKIISDAEVEATKIKSDTTVLYDKVKEQEIASNKKVADADKAMADAKELMDRAGDALRKANNLGDNNKAIESCNEVLRIKLSNIVKTIQEMLK